MKKTFLEYYKIILSKVKFDQTLFQKEYQKAVGILKPQEVKILNRWVEEIKR